MNSGTSIRRWPEEYEHWQTQAIKLNHLTPTAPFVYRFDPGATLDGRGTLGHLYQRVSRIASGTDDGAAFVSDAVSEYFRAKIALVWPFHPATPTGTLACLAQTYFTGFSSGTQGGSGSRVILSGTRSLGEMLRPT